MLRWLYPIALAAIACSGRADAPANGGPTPARAFVITDAKQLIEGATATGAVGDYRLDNGVVAVVVNAPDHVLGFALSGGNLVDAARVEGPARRDSLRQMTLYLDDTFPRQAIYDRVEIARAEGDEAVVIATGRDSDDDTLAIRHEYRLARGVDYLTLRTTVTNTGAHAVADYDLGDVIQWGRCERYLPGLGWAKGRVGTPWVAGECDGVSYGYTARDGTLAGPHGSSWSDPIVRTVELAPGASATYERYLVIGDDSGVAGVTRRIHALRGDDVGELRAAVREASGTAVAGARIEVVDADGKPAASALADSNGEALIPLAPGQYRATATAPGRAACAPASVTINGEPVELELALAAASRVTVALDGPAKLTFLGVDGTAHPVLHPRHEARGERNAVVALAGEVTVPLPPGSYEVIASRGPEFTLARARVELAPGVEHRVQLSPTRAIETPGYVSGDFHQHALPSGDTGLTRRDRIVSNLAEGVEIMVTTEHNVLASHRALVAELGVADHLYAMSGLEATSETVGHFNAYPVDVRPDAPRAGAPEMHGRSPAQIMASLRELADEVVIQVNHPRADRAGYFGITGFDPRRDEQPPHIALDFDALEVFNGKRLGHVEQTLRDWFWLLDHGHRVTAMGNSDSHAITGNEVGYPRSYLGVGTDDPGVLTDALVRDAILRKRDVVVTNGPFITVRRDDASVIGKTLHAPRGGTMAVDLYIDAADWVDVNELTVLRQGKVYRVSQVGRGHRERLELPVGDGTWYVLIVRGQRTLAPVVPDALPFAITNPIWLEPAE